MNQSSWNMFDVVVAGLLIAGLIGAFVIVGRKSVSKRQKYVAYAVIVFIFAFIWAELAVGLIGSPLAGN